MDKYTLVFRFHRNDGGGYAGEAVVVGPISLKEAQEQLLKRSAMTTAGIGTHKDDTCFATWPNKAPRLHVPPGNVLVLLNGSPLLDVKVDLHNNEVRGLVPVPEKAEEKPTVKFKAGDRVKRVHGTPGPYQNGQIVERVGETDVWRLKLDWPVDLKDIQCSSGTYHTVECEDALELIQDEPKKLEAKIGSRIQYRNDAFVPLVVRGCKATIVGESDDDGKGWRIILDQDKKAWCSVRSPYKTDIGRIFDLLDEVVLPAEGLTARIKESHPNVGLRGQFVTLTSFDKERQEWLTTTLYENIQTYLSKPEDLIMFPPAPDTKAEEKVKEEPAKDWPPTPGSRWKVLSQAESKTAPRHSFAVSSIVTADKNGGYPDTSLLPEYQNTWNFLGEGAPRYGQFLAREQVEPVVEEVPKPVEKTAEEKPKSLQERFPAGSRVKVVAITSNKSYRECFIGKLGTIVERRGQLSGHVYARLDEIDDSRSSRWFIDGELELVAEEKKAPAPNPQTKPWPPKPGTKWKVVTGPRSNKVNHYAALDEVFTAGDGSRPVPANADHLKNTWSFLTDEGHHAWWFSVDDVEPVVEEEKKPEPRFKVGDWVLVKDHKFPHLKDKPLQVQAIADHGHGFRLNTIAGTNWFHEDSLKPCPFRSGARVKVVSGSSPFLHQTAILDKCRTGKLGEYWLVNMEDEYSTPVAFATASLELAPLPKAVWPPNRSENPEWVLTDKGIEKFRMIGAKHLEPVVPTKDGNKYWFQPVKKEDQGIQVLLGKDEVEPVPF